MCYEFVSQYRVLLSHHCSTAYDVTPDHRKVMARVKTAVPFESALRVVSAEFKDAIPSENLNVSQAI